MASSPSGLRSIALAFRDRNYRTLALGNAVNFTGTWMQRIGVSWLTWELTHSGTWLGIVAMADLFPTILIGPFAGAVTDRYDRMRVFRISQAVATIQAVLLAGLLAVDAVTVWLLLLLQLILGIATSFRFAVQLAIVPSLVPRELVGAAVAFNSTTFNTARFVGPAIAGVVIHRWGIAEAIAVTAVLNIGFFIVLYWIRPVREEYRPSRQSGVLADVVEGFRYVAGHDAMAKVFLLLITVSVGGRAIIELLPKIADQSLGQDAGGFATLVAALGAGAVVVGLWLSGRGHKEGLVRLSIAMALVLAAAAILVTQVSVFWIAVAIMFVFGFTSSGVGITSQTALQLAIDGRMRGRVMSLYGMIFRGGPALGALIVGSISDFGGIRLPILCAGGMIIAVAVWLWTQRTNLMAALEPAVGETEPGDT